MDFNSLVNEVYLITGREDLVNETSVAVRSATLKAHQSDFYPKDLVEHQIGFDCSEYVQTLQYLSIDPQWRALKYIRLYDPCSCDHDKAQGPFLDLIDPQNTLDFYGSFRNNVAYLAGTNYQLRADRPFNRALIAYFVHPTLLPTANFNSWIANEHPYAIIFGAASKIFKAIGFDEQAQYWNQELAEQYQELKAQVVGGGY